MADLTITLGEIVTNARLAHTEGRLQAQTSPGRNRRCSYAGPCGIGASVPADVAKKWDECDTAVSTLMNQDLLVVWNGRTTIAPESREYNALVYIQNAHDEWTKTEEEYRPGCELAFLNALDAAQFLVDKTV